MTVATDVLLVGARGFGAVHLRNLERLGPRIRLIGLCDPSGGPTEGFGAGTPCWPSLDAAFADGLRPDVVIVATPTGTHFALASLALEHGCDVYLEKPPVATMAQFTQLLDLQARTGRAVQVGFQSFGSHALDEIAALGAPTSIATWATWTRDIAYWTRSPWAGLRTQGETPIVDGVLTNALSHAIATSLRIAGAHRVDDIALIELDQYRANDIEADDTSSVRITLTDGRIIAAALTLAGAEQTEPVIEVRTPQTDVVFTYTEDLLTYPDGRTSHTDRIDLFEQLLDHRTLGAPLLSPLADTGAFMAVLEAVRTAPDPRPIPDAALTVITDRESPVTAVDDVAFWVERTARAGALFRELHAPFASPASPGKTLDLAVDGTIVAVRDDGSGVTTSSGPRPFLHPIRTLGGVVVTDAHPADHDWHLGASIAVQHANGVNFWGGPTYTSSLGYRWLDDHGRIDTSEITRTESGFTATALWRTPTGDTLLTETTEWRLRASPDPQAWTFETTTTLHAGDTDVTLGSPATHGRIGAGYGGFAWRFPAASDVIVRTADATGEEATHGTVSPWIAFTATFPDGRATVALAGADAATSADPWFVRVEDYPGIGSSLAWEHPVVIAAGETLTRSFRGLVADGAPDDDNLVRLLG